jgi:transcriptional regulator with XRE-family HTH domain
MPKTLRTPAHTALMQSLISFRKQQNFTQQQLASAIGRPQSYVAKVETGERRIDAVELVIWSLALKVSTEDILRPVEDALVRKAP